MEEQQKRTVEFLHERAKGVDVIITTAQIFGRKAPVLITEAAVKDMRPGSVIIGPSNLPASLPTHASQMYAKNVQSFVGEFSKDGKATLDFSNEVIAGTTITHEGRVVHERTRQAMGEA